MLELVARFLVIGALAFGGGQAALPLVERLAVADTGWLTPAQFATGVGLSYATPGPILILAAFIAIEAQANNAKLQSLGSEEGAKVAQNVVAGVAGLFIWPLWFAMDFQDAAGKETASVNGRNQYLTAMAMQRNCGAPAPHVAQYSVQPQPAAVGAVYSRPPVLYTASPTR